MALRTERFSEPAAFLHGLSTLRRSGLTPRGLLFLALDPQGAIHITVPEDADEVTRIKVGDKLGLSFPLEGRYFHFDSVHRLRDSYFLFNGDRRLSHPGDATDAAALIADFLKATNARNVFFGCTPHQPGSWLVRERATTALHEAGGFVEVVPIRDGLLARRVMDHRLWLRPEVAANRLSDWQPVYESPLGNVLMLERRIIHDRLVLSCQRGLVEVDLSALPTVTELGRVDLTTGFAVVGRVENTAFAVTQGKPEEWGLDELRPAVLIGAEGGSLAALGDALRAAKKQ